MISPAVVWEYYITHVSTAFDVSEKFGISIEDTYKLLKEGHALDLQQK